MIEDTQQRLFIEILSKQIKNGKCLEALHQSGNKTRIFTLTTNFQHCTGSAGQCNKIRKNNRQKRK